MSSTTLRRLIIIALIVLWEVLPRAGIIPELFLPSLQGNNPSRFVARGNTVTADQAPAAGAFTGAAVLTAPPLYGSPTGFGAGNTGFDSTNARRKQRARPHSRP